MHHLSPVLWCDSWRMRYITGSRRLRFGEAMSIFARSTFDCRRGTRPCACDRTGRGSPRRERLRNGLSLPPAGQRAAGLADLLGGLVVDVRHALLDQLDARTRTSCRSSRDAQSLLGPREAEPADVLLDRAGRTPPPPWRGWCRRSAGCRCRRIPRRCRSSGRCSWRGRCGDSRWAPAESAWRRGRPTCRCGGPPRRSGGRSRGLRVQGDHCQTRPAPAGGWLA